MEGKDVFSASVEKEVPKAEAFEVNKSRSGLDPVLSRLREERVPKGHDDHLPVFRQQMQALKDANIPVIPMSDVLAWKRGEKNIPEESVVITMDDGWLGVHQFAYPILKEFNYPFTFYLYKKYVGPAGGRMTVSQIKEMLMDGAEWAATASRHQALSAKNGKTPEQYRRGSTRRSWRSKKLLEETFQVPCTTFAYPYGPRREEIVQDDASMLATRRRVTVNPRSARGTRRMASCRASRRSATRTGISSWPPTSTVAVAASRTASSSRRTKWTPRGRNWWI